MLQIVKNRKIPFTISAVLFIVSLVLLFTLGLKQGIDFTGGSLLEVRYTTETAPSNVEVQEMLVPLELGTVQVQSSGENKLLLRLRFLSEEEHQTVLKALRGKETILQEEGQGDTAPTVLEERFETIGPSISAHLRSRAISAAIAVVVAIIIYLAYTFRKVSKPVQSWKYGITAIIALIHDVTITMGVFVLLGHFYGVEIDIPFVVALLTILGYSVNDTIVVFDRVRENLIKRGRDNFAETVNIGVNETIRRSVNTSLTTLLVLFVMFQFGGDSIHYFSLALIVGIAVGTYSSIFIASPLLVVWQKFKQ